MRGRWIILGVAAFAACARPEAKAFTGFVDAPISSVVSQVAGKVSVLPAREGDRVHKGDVLAQLEATTYEAAVAQAEANVERSRQGVRQAEATFKAALPTVAGASADIARARAVKSDADSDLARVERLTASGSIPIAQLDPAQARALQARAALDGAIALRAESSGRVAVASAGIDEARAQLVASEAGLRLARAQLAQTRIVSPFDGIVVARNLEEGEWAGPGTPVVTIEDDSRPWVRLDVPETALGKVRLDEMANVRLIALPNRAFQAHVTEIGAEGDFALDRDVKRGRPDVRTFLVRVAFDPASPELRPGMTAQVELTGEVKPSGREEARR